MRRSAEVGSECFGDGQRKKVVVVVRTCTKMVSEGTVVICFSLTKYRLKLLSESRLERSGVTE